MVDEYKKAIQAQRKKSAWMAVGAAIVIHVLFILSEEVAMAFGLAAIGVLIYALYAETTGHRMNMVVAFVLSGVIHVGVFVYDHLFGIGVEEK